MLSFIKRTQPTNSKHNRLRERLTLNQFWRTFITRLADKGIGVRVLAELAGHSSIAVTQRYTDVNDTQLAQAVELI